MLSSWLCGELLAALQGGEAAPSDAEQSLYSQPDLKGRRRTFCDMCVYAFFCVVIFFFFLETGPRVALTSDPQPPRCWGYRFALTCLANRNSLSLKAQ